MFVFEAHSDKKLAKSRRTKSSDNLFALATQLGVNPTILNGPPPKQQTG